jgi:hypothetical protein
MMSVNGLRTLARTRSTISPKLRVLRSPGRNVCIRHSRSSRNYATHGSFNMDFGSTDSSLLKKATSTRNYATHGSFNMDFGSTDSSLLKKATSTRQTSEPKHDHVGPFQLGLSPASLRQGEKVPRWSELSTSGKGISSSIFSLKI